MEMFSERILGETPELHGEGVRMRFIGRREGVAPELVEQMAWAEETTAANERITLFVAFNYGGRAEIVDAARRFEGGDEEDFAKLLYAPEMHDPDLVIRTSGEQRLSNYLLWQSAYSELHFTDVLWPDFSRADLEAALEAYESRRPPLRRALMASRSRSTAPPLARRVGPAGARDRRAAGDRVRDLHHRLRRLGVRGRGVRARRAVPARAVPHVRGAAAGQARRLPRRSPASRWRPSSATSARCCWPWSRSCR